MTDKKYDLSLGDWGPYNKEYLGVCNIADKKRGATFNIELFPGFFRRNVIIPNTKYDTGVKMWKANADLTRFCYRYELQWKDEIYCDVDFNITDDTQVDVTCTFVNNTDLNQSLDITLCASLQLPTNKPGSETVGYLDFYKPILPNDCIYIDATEHCDIKCETDIASDGGYLGEEIQNNASGLGTVIDKYYFHSPKHYLKYCFNEISSDSMGIRYRCRKETTIIIKTPDNRYTIDLPCANDYCYYSFPIKKEELSKFTVFATGEGINIDSFCLGKNADQVVYEKIEHNLTPEKAENDNTLTLKYKDIPDSYTIKWHEPIRMQRRCHCIDIGKLLQLTVNDHASHVIHGYGDGVYESFLSTPIYLAPKSKEERHFTIYKGTKELEKKEHEFTCIESNPDGSPYLFSQNMMRYNTLLNVVYPIYTRRQYIKHNTPGRFWDSLYSWDSGFIGMGLSLPDFKRGFECLNTYLVPVGDRHSPYIFHGSVVPTQILLYKHLIDNYPEHKDELKSIYPMIKQYYSFYADMDSSDGQLASGLIKTWHLSRNSGGWDDYPPQDHLNNPKRDNVVRDYDHSNTTPVITTAYAVLISKIMQLIARDFEYDNDIEYYEQAEKKYTERIHKYDLWDDEVGYFSYMIHDKNGFPYKKLRYKDNSNFNKGFDGITPYIADICTEEQEDKILDNIKNGLMTDIGVGVVDTRASYYSNHGYWNGSVWMPHQWILWKSLIDRGQTDLAFEIASKALNIWAKEVDASYCCFEHFMCHNGRGSGYHQFSGLSCPVSLFFAGYYTPGTITTGFATLIKNATWNTDKTKLDFTADVQKDNTSIIICMNSDKKYIFTVNGKNVNAAKITQGAYSLNLPKGNITATISVPG